MSRIDEIKARCVELRKDGLTSDCLAVIASKLFAFVDVLVPQLFAYIDEQAAALAQYRKAEREGLPIKPGTPVWVLEKKLGSPRYDMVRERFVNSFGFSTDGYTNMQLMVPEGAYPYPVHDVYQEIDKIGKTVFLARAEAEQALRTEVKKNVEGLLP